MSAVPSVALVDDDDDLRAATAQLLALAGYAVRQFPDAAAALAVLDADFPGVVATDIRMPGMSGIELFRVLRARDPELPVILMTGHGDIDTAVSTLKEGAWDFLTKPFAPDALLGAVARATATRGLAMENRRLRVLAEASAADELVGSSEVIRRLRATIPVLADADLDVVLEGATGTGKELFARLVHRAGKRARHRFVAVDCAVLPPGHADDLLGGYGLVARADRGTLFLDNLDRADEALQYRLAQFAEQRAVASGGREPQPVDVRVIAAINADARARVLPALYHRLAGVSLRLPSLAERLEDLPLLVAHFLSVHAARHRRPARPLAEAATLLARRDWPGNVRELEMAVERLALGLDENVAAETPDLPLPDRLRAIERAAIVEAITRTGGDITQTVALLGIPRETFYYRVKRLDIDLRAIRERLACKQP